MRTSEQLQVLASEADRYSSIAEQSANRIHVSLTVGLAAISADLAAAFVAQSPIVLSFAPVIGGMVIAIAVFGSLESLYASAYHARAEARIRGLLGDAADSIPLYGRGSRQRKHMARLGGWMWGIIMATFALLAIADFIAAFWLADPARWTPISVLSETRWVIWGCLGFVAITALIMIYRFGRAWFELAAFQEKYLDEAVTRRPR